MKSTKRLLAIILLFILFFVSMLTMFFVDAKADTSEDDISYQPGIIHADAGFPVAYYSYISAGTWYYPASYGGGWHPGMDIAAPMGTPALAIGDGIILFADWDAYGMTLVYLTELESGVYTLIYGHLSEFVTVKNQQVSQGETIALVGSTGKSTGPHLHVEVFYHHNQTIDEVLQKYQRQGYTFGLSYGSIGNCKNVCRLRPEYFFGKENEI